MPKIPRSVRPAGIMGVRKSLLVGIVVVVVLVGLGAAWAVYRVTTGKPKAAAAPLPPVTSTMTQSRKAILVDEPRSYDQIPKPKPKPALPPTGVAVGRVEAATRPPDPPPQPPRREAKVDPLPTPAGPSQAEIDARIRAAVAEKMLQMREEQNRELQAQLAASQARQGSQPVQGQMTKGQAGSTTTADQRKKGWRLSEDDGAVLKGPYGEAGKPEGETEAQPGKSKLLQRAEWIAPADPTKVVYRTQVLRAVTLTRLSSDTPQSDVRLLITSDVWDRWHRRVLIPQQSLLVGVSQGGRPTPGERRVTATIAELHFPDGTILDMAQSKLNDREGQAGLTGEVDNHLPQIGLAILINSALNVFARGAAGSPTGFQENLPQQYAAQAGQAANESAKEVVKQQLQRPPTILVEAGEPVTITLQGNVNLAHPPKIVR